MFCGNRPYQTTIGSRQEPPEPADLNSNKDFPADLAVVLKKCTAWDPAERYPVFEEIRVELCRIYEKLFQKKSLFADFEMVGLEADGLNNQGASFYELGRKEDALRCWQEALRQNPDHPESTFNMLLEMWRGGETDDLEVLEYLQDLKSNSLVSDETLAEMAACVHAERCDLQAASETLKDFPGNFKVLFSGSGIDQMGSCRKFGGHAGPVTALAVIGGGRQVLSADSKGILMLRDIGARRKNDQNVCKIDIRAGGVNAVSVSADGKRAVCAGSDGGLRMIDLKAGCCVAALHKHTGSINAAVLSADGCRALTASHDQSVCMWKLDWEKNSGMCVCVLEEHTDWVTAAALSADGKRALTVSHDQSVRMWELNWEKNSGKCVCVLEGHVDWVNTVVFDAGGSRAVSGGRDSVLMLWELDWQKKSGRCCGSMSGRDSSVRAVDMSPDGRMVLSGNINKTLKLWKIDWKTR